MLDNKTIKKDKENKKYGLTPLEKRFVKIYILLAVFYAITSVYLLNTPIDEWVFNLGQYNNQLLEVFPKAQYWVNISVAYREKMIPLYVLYQGIFWFVFVSTIAITIVQWKSYNNSFSPKCNRKWFMVFFLPILIFAIVGMFMIGLGSEQYMYYENLDKVGRNNDILVWNNVFGFITYKIIAIGGVWGMPLLCNNIFWSIVICFKDNFNKGE